MKKFEIGKCYYAKSVCDQNCNFEIRVIDRTEKMVTIIDDDGKIKKTKIFIDNNAEYVIPDKYSFAPVYRTN